MSRRKAIDGSSILLVEDDADIREMMNVVLDAAGVSVSQAATADEARAIVDSALGADGETAVDAALVDWNLGGSTAADLIADLVRRAPQLDGRIAVVTGDLMSAGPANHAPSHPARELGLPLLPKPFRPAELLGVVARPARRLRPAGHCHARALLRRALPCRLWPCRLWPCRLWAGRRPVPADADLPSSVALRSRHLHVCAQIVDQARADAADSLQILHRAERARRALGYDRLGLGLSDTRKLDELIERRRVHVEPLGGSGRAECACGHHGDHCGGDDRRAESRASRRYLCDFVVHGNASLDRRASNRSATGTTLG